MQYNKKKRIAKSLISGSNTMRSISKEAKDFIVEWCMTDNTGKTKDMYDIWEIVLRNYLPNETPVLFRGSEYINFGKIESYTTKISCAERFATSDQGDSGNKEYYLLIMDTRHFKILNSKSNIGEYQYSYYPIFQLLAKEKSKKNSNFSKRFIDNYECEEECVTWTKASEVTVCKIVELV